MQDDAILKQDAVMPLSENADTPIRRHVVSPGGYIAGNAQFLRTSGSLTCRTMLPLKQDDAMPLSENADARHADPDSFPPGWLYRW